MSFHTADLNSLSPAQLQEYLTNLKMVDMRRQALGTASDVGTSMVDGGRILVDRYNQAVTPMAQNAQRGIQGILAKGGGMGARGAIRFAGSAPVLTALKLAPALGAAGGVAGIADVITGEESAANKAMDIAAMGGGAMAALKGAGAGAAIGSVVPVVGTAAGGAVGAILGGLTGAGLGKMGSDAVQYIAGGGKSAEERKMEEALAMLRSGGMV